MKVFIEKEGIEKELNFEGDVRSLLEKLEINIESVLVVRNNEILQSGEKVLDSDEIKILSVISGG